MWRATRWAKKLKVEAFPHRSRRAFVPIAHCPPAGAALTVRRTGPFLPPESRPGIGPRARQDHLPLCQLAAPGGTALGRGSAGSDASSWHRERMDSSPCMQHCISFCRQCMRCGLQCAIVHSAICHRVHCCAPSPDGFPTVGRTVGSRGPVASSTTCRRCTRRGVG